MSNHVLAVIPARGGSKGVPHKNMRKVAGRPLVAWSIDAAQELLAEFPSPSIVVSSDADDILDYAEGHGAIAERRPDELATDTALTDPVLVHCALGEERRSGSLPDVVVLLQPTVPVRRPGLVIDCVARLQETEADAVLTAYPLHFVWWREGGYEYHGDTGGPSPAHWRTQCPRRPRRQDMHARELMWHEDGSVFVVRTQTLLETGSRVAGRIEVVETERTVDIDTEDDLLVADALLRARLRAREAA